MTLALPVLALGTGLSIVGLIILAVVLLILLHLFGVI